MTRPTPPSPPDWGYAEKHLDAAFWNAYRKLALFKGFPRPTQRQVANEMGLSRATVRRRLALVGVTRYGEVHKLIDELP